MIETNYSIDNKTISYEVTNDGYKIYLDGQLWIHQYEPYIPNPSKSYEENAIAQIEEIYNGYQASLQEKQEQASIQDQITNLELALAELYEAQQGGIN